MLDTSPYRHIRFSCCSTDFSLRPVAVSYTGDVWCSTYLAALVFTFFPSLSQV